MGRTSARAFVSTFLMRAAVMGPFGAGTVATGLFAVRPFAVRAGMLTLPVFVLRLGFAMTLMSAALRPAMTARSATLSVAFRMTALFTRQLLRIDRLADNLTAGRG